MDKIKIALFITLFGSIYSSFVTKKTFSSNDCTGLLLEIDSKTTDYCLMRSGNYYKLRCDEYSVSNYKCTKDCQDCEEESSYPHSTCLKSEFGDATSTMYSCATTTGKSAFDTANIIAKFLPREYFDAHYRSVEAILTASSNAVSNDACPYYASFFGAMGSALGLAAANCGAAFGIAISFGGYIALGSKGRAMLIKGLVPAIMASVRGVYGLIISILIAVQIEDHNYSLVKAFAHLFAGLAVGLSGLASGYCMGVVGRTGMIAVSRQPRLYIGILLILIFAEAIGLYGLIIGLILLGVSPPQC